ncbi:MAG TPA: hypothetical protein VMF06_20130 [Candidatus Limnocylindria bacterium]|jgi:hypothetical protein|nr:hypothetical protein [Candidatus Limnocylindria bacterium]
MNAQHIAPIVDEAIRLDRQLEDIKEKLNAKKALLSTLAEDAPDYERIPTEGGGWSVTYTGSSGAIARVTQCGPKLKSAIDAEKPAGAKLMERVGKFRDQLFKPVLKWTPVEDIREKVASLFKSADAKAILRAISSEGTVSVSFETKEKEGE